jgi:hypothetical protein
MLSYRQPEVFVGNLIRSSLSSGSSGHNRCLAIGLDLGTTCGVSGCFFDPASSWIYPGDLAFFCQWDLSISGNETKPTRLVRLKQFLSCLSPDIIFYEDVKNSSPPKGGATSAAAILARVCGTIEWFGELKGIIKLYAEENEIPCLGYGISTIKKRATGSGRASKVDMIQAVNNVYNVNLPVEEFDKSGADNIADSVWTLILGMEDYARGVVKLNRSNVNIHSKALLAAEASKLKSQIDESVVIEGNLRSSVLSFLKKISG